MPYKDNKKAMDHHREYMRRKFHDDPVFKAKHLERVAKNKARYRAAVLASISDFKKNGCAICNETDECCLSAHHLDPLEKEFEIGDSIGIGFALKKVQEEMLKCICLCENCHRKVHAGRIQLTMRVEEVLHPVP